MDRETRSHLKGIVAIWLTNGNVAVDGGNDTRYEFFSGGWMEAAHATRELIEEGYLWSPVGDHFEDSSDAIRQVAPTAKGVFEAIS